MQHMRVCVINIFLGTTRINHHRQSFNNIKNEEPQLVGYRKANQMTLIQDLVKDRKAFPKPLRGRTTFQKIFFRGHFVVLLSQFCNESSIKYGEG